MRFVFIIIIVFFSFMLNGCQTIEKKSQKAIKIENEKLSQFLQKSESNLKIVMGEPDLVNQNDEGSKFFIYTKKKYNITCERSFEIDKNKIVVGFTSKGCF
jgi:hypothetical protein